MGLGIAWDAFHHLLYHFLNLIFKQLNIIFIKLNDEKKK